MRDARHYKNLINKNSGAGIGFALAASAVYACRFGSCEAKHHSTPEWRQIASDLKSRYGENLTADDTLIEMGAPKNETISIRIPSDLLKQIDLQAEQDGRTRSNMIVFILRKYFSEK